MRVAITEIKTPDRNTGRLPNRPINNEAGSVANMTARNCRDRGSVANHNSGARMAPAKPVLIIFTFMTVIDRPCAAVMRQTLAGIFTSEPDIR